MNDIRTKYLIRSFTGKSLTSTGIYDVSTASWTVSSSSVIPYEKMGIAVIDSSYFPADYCTKTSGRSALEVLRALDYFPYLF